MLFLTFGCNNDDDDNVEPEPVVEASFENDADGWTITGDAQGGSNLEASYSPFEGLDNSGYIFADDDVAGGTWYFSAPQKLLGDLSTYAEGTMSYWMIQESARNNQFESRDVIVENNDNVIYYKYENVESFPDTTWTEYTLRINASDRWFNDENEPASNEEINAVLSNVTNLYIRGEFETGADTGGLDQFVLRAN
ncbi:MAG: laminin B domain-containing protein [Bacteroidota bacterium]